MKTNGFDRAMRYFVREAELYVLGTIGGSILLSVYMWLIINRGNFFEILDKFPVSFFYTSAVIILSITATAGQRWFPMLISLGCRRKNIFWGHLLMLFLFILQTLALYQLSGFISGAEKLPLQLFTILTIDLAVAGVTTFLNIAMLRWGKIIYILMVILIVAISMFYGMWAGLYAPSGANSSVLLIEQWPILPRLILFTACLAVFTAANILNYRTLSTYEVKA